MNFEISVNLENYKNTRIRMTVDNRYDVRISQIIKSLTINDYYLINIENIGH